MKITFLNAKINCFLDRNRKGAAKVFRNFISNRRLVLHSLHFTAVVFVCRCCQIASNSHCSIIGVVRPIDANATNSICCRKFIRNSKCFGPSWCHRKCRRSCQFYRQVSYYFKSFGVIPFMRSLHNIKRLGGSVVLSWFEFAFSPFHDFCRFLSDIFINFFRSFYWFTFPTGNFLPSHLQLKNQLCWKSDLGSMVWLQSPSHPPAITLRGQFFSKQSTVHSISIWSLKAGTKWVARRVVTPKLPIDHCGKSLTY